MRTIIVLGVLTGLVANEISNNFPHVKRLALRLSILLVPKGERARWEEEWPGEIAAGLRILQVVDLVRGAVTIRWDSLDTSPERLNVCSIRFAALGGGLGAVAATMCSIGAAALGDHRYGFLLVGALGMILASGVAASGLWTDRMPRVVTGAIRSSAIVLTPLGGASALVGAFVFPFERFGGAATSIAAVSAGVGILVAGIAASVAMRSERIARPAGMAAFAAALWVALSGLFVVGAAAGHGGVAGVWLAVAVGVGTVGALLGSSAAVMYSRPEWVTWLVGRSR